MQLDWQSTMVLAAVAAAGVYLARMAWQSVARRKGASCGGCGNCPQEVPQVGLVSIERLSESAQAIAGPGTHPDAVDR
jgi:hypothetical protein